VRRENADAHRLGVLVRGQDFEASRLDQAIARSG
jgi:hypothetical protein